MALHCLLVESKLLNMPYKGFHNLALATLLVLSSIILSLSSCPNGIKLNTSMTLYTLFFFFFLILFYLFIYPFMAVLGLRFCARAFSSCGKWGPLFIVVRGPLTVTASLVAEHRLQTRRLSNCGSRT